jgi:hypothetical protein
LVLLQLQLSLPFFSQRLITPARGRDTLGGILILIFIFQPEAGHPLGGIFICLRAERQNVPGLETADCWTEDCGLISLLLLQLQFLF